MTYSQIPAVDENFNFPPQIALAFSQSPQLAVVIADKVTNDPNVANSAATLAQSSVGLIPKWKANTAYTAGQWVVNPSGDIVVAKTNFTSGATYSATNWDYTSAYNALQTLIATKFPDLGRLIPATPGPDSIDNYKTQGFYKVWTAADAQNLGLPWAVASRIWNVAIGSYVQQEQITTDTPIRKISRLWNGSSWSAWGIESRLIGNLTNTVGADKALTIDGLYIVASSAVANTLGLPDGTYGTLERITWSSGNIVRLTWRPNQTARTYEMTYEPAIGTWSPWRLVGRGVKNVAVALTTSGPIAVNNWTAVHGRVPFKLAVDTNRFRVHFRNYNYRQWLSYAGSLDFLGAGFGELVLDGGELTSTFKAAPLSISGAVTTNQFGNEWVTPWVNVKTKANTPYAISYAYNSPSGQDNFGSVGGGWLSTNTAGLLDVADGTLAKTKQLPLDIWIEVEVDAGTRVIAYLGDSLTCGVSADLPVYDSWANRHALKQGALPMMYGFSGDGFNGYINSAQPKLTKWAAQARPDALVCALGSNNIFQGNDMATMQAQMKTALDLVTAVTCNNVYLTTILPRFTAQSAYEPMRKTWNDYLKTALPYNAVACFEAAEKFTDASGDLLDVKWAASSTDFHLNRAGYARFAAQVPAL